jgi:deoxyribodipyrimidine photo-lyase
LKINDQLKQIGSSLLVKRRNRSVFKALAQEFDIKVFFNRDYEQYAIARDHKICEFWRVRTFCFFPLKTKSFLKKRNYKIGWITVYRLYSFKNKWLENTIHWHQLEYIAASTSTNFYNSSFVFPSLGEIGFEESTIKVQPYNLTDI